MLLMILGLSACNGSDGDDVRAVPATADAALAPERTNDNWPVQNASDVATDPSRLTSLYTAIKERQYQNIDSVVVAKDGALVFEAYYNGYDRQQTHDLRSATKSITSVLSGIALDNGYIQSVDDPAYEYLDAYLPFENESAQKQSITVENLLTMSSGLACDDWQSESPGNEEKMYEEDDWVSFIFDLPMVREPGIEFAYCTGGVVALGEVIRAATGTAVDEFAENFLFSQLGIEDYQWAFTPTGQVDTGGHIHMKPRDMAKIGQLYLQQGMWDGQQLVSEAWVETSTTDKLQVNNQQLWYAYLWWNESRPYGDGSMAYYYAQGNGGQYIAVFPELELVVVFTGSNFNSSLTYELPNEMMDDYILPAFYERLDGTPD